MFRHDLINPGWRDRLNLRLQLSLMKGGINVLKLCSADIKETESQKGCKLRKLAGCSMDWGSHIMSAQMDREGMDTTCQQRGCERKTCDLWPFTTSQNIQCVKGFTVQRLNTPKLDRMGPDPAPAEQFHTMMICYHKSLNCFIKKLCKNFPLIILDSVFILWETAS